uniref:Sm domain-containing protein n=1 Tax=Acrobeloides nanus TaxID=290746 RepID=A0A914CCV4_9BILA
MNCQMSDVSVTHRDGRINTLENVFVRGSQVRFCVLPDMLKNAPMFKNIGRAQSGARGMGMGDRRGDSGRGGPFRGRGGQPRRFIRGGAPRGGGYRG